MIKKNYRSIIVAVLIATAAAIGWWSVSVTRAASTPQVCGDGVVQAPEKCDDGTGTNANPVPTETARCTAACGEKMLGWAWSDSSGWAELNNTMCNYLDPGIPASSCVLSSPTTIYYVQATIDNQVTGWAWSDHGGWICFGTTCTGTPPAGTLQASIVADPSNPEQPLVTGWAQFVSLGDNGWISLNCQNTGGCSTSNYNVRMMLGTFTNTSVQPNTTEQRLTLSGWGWNNIYGWVQFNPLVNGIPAWLQTKYGDIYSRGGLTGKQAPGYNATYRILSSGSIQQFTSAQGADQFWVSPNLGPINFPTPETGFSNILGKLDVNGLLCMFDASGTCVNQFGTTVVNLNQPGQSLSTQQLMAGKIYYYKGNLVINSPITFTNGTNFDNAAGTIIVDGELDLNANTSYDSATQPARFRNMASVAWIVRGDVKIAPSVTQAAGNFIVIGNGTLSTPNACDPNKEVAACGQIYSCANGSAAQCNTQLNVSGLMMARKFYFTRTYASQAGGSELIIYDGRLLANTPPGVTDFAKALPIWRSTTFAP